jgi:hypothetical protein
MTSLVATSIDGTPIKPSVVTDNKDMSQSEKQKYEMKKTEKKAN